MLAGDVAGRFAELHEYRYVFLAQRWIGYPEAQLELLDRSLKAIVDSGAIPVVLQPVAEDGQNASQCFFTHIKLQAAYKNECRMKADNDFAVEKKRFVTDLFARMASKYPTAIFVDPQHVQCNAG